MFNYSIKENILYGKMTASNQEIIDAVTISNAIDFITDSELNDAFDDDCSSLLEAMKSEKHRENMIALYVEEARKKHEEEKAKKKEGELQEEPVEISEEEL